MANTQLILETLVKGTEEARSNLNKISGSVGNLGGVIEKNSSHIKALGAAATAVFATISAIAVKTSLDYGKFNYEIERAGAFVNASKQEMEEFQKAAISAARGTRFSFEDTAKALGSFVGGEIDAITATKELGSVIDLALIGGMNNLQDAVNMGELALTVFKNDAIGMSGVMDILATVASDVTTETDRWSTAIVNSAGSAKSAGMSFKDLNIVFSAMKRGGADVGLMWSAFNGAMLSIQSPTKKVHEGLSSVGLSVDGLQGALASGPVDFLSYLKVGFDKANESGQGFAFLAKVLGRQAAPEFALALGLTNEELQETAEYFDDIDGRGQVMVDRLRAAIPPLERMHQAFKELSIMLGKAFAPAMEALANIMIPIIQKLSEFIAENPKLSAGILIVIGAIAGLVAGFAGILLIIGKLIALKTTMAAGWAALGILFKAIIIPAAVAVGGAIAAISAPVWIIIGVIAALIAAGVLLYKNWDVVKEKTIEIWGVVSEWLVSSWKKLIEIMMDVWGAVVGFFKKIWDGIVDVFKFAISLIVGIVILLFKAMGVDIVGVFTTIRDTLWLFWEGAKNLFNESLIFIQELWSTSWTAVSTFFSQVWDAIYTTISIIWGKIKELASKGMDWLASTFIALATPIKDAWDTMWNFLGSTVTSIWDKVKETVVASINFIIDKINMVIRMANKVAQMGASALGLNIKTLPEIPRLAKGGIVTKPTLAMVGEAGPEAVIPLSKAGATGGFGGITINFTGTFGKDAAEEIGDMIVMKLSRAGAI